MTGSADIRSRTGLSEISLEQSWIRQRDQVSSLNGTIRDGMVRFSGRRMHLISDEIVGSAKPDRIDRKNRGFQ